MACERSMAAAYGRRSRPCCLACRHAGVAALRMHGPPQGPWKSCRDCASRTGRARCGSSGSSALRSLAHASGPLMDRCFVVVRLRHTSVPVGPPMFALELVGGRAGKPTLFCRCAEHHVPLSSIWRAAALWSSSTTARRVPASASCGGTPPAPPAPPADPAAANGAMRPQTLFDLMCFVDMQCCAGSTAHFAASRSTSSRLGGLPVSEKGFRLGRCIAFYSEGRRTASCGA